MLRHFQNKKLIFFFIILFFICTNIIFALDVESLFNLKNDGDIVYYKSDDINSVDYKNADNIKQKLNSEGYNIYSIVIADILPSQGNEYIALTSVSNINKIIVFSKEKIVFSYEAPYTGYNSALDLESFLDKDSNITIMKYYILIKNDKDREIRTFMFRIDGVNIDLVSDISFYKEINSMVTPVKIQMDNVFADIDGDSIHEMLVESRESIFGRDDLIEYQIYKLSKSKKDYVCIFSSWLEDSFYDFSSYFKK